MYIGTVRFKLARSVRGFWNSNSEPSKTVKGLPVFSWRARENLLLTLTVAAKANISQKQSRL